MNYTIDFKKIKMRMFELDLSQRKLAKSLDISAASVGRKLNGDSEFTLREAQMISEILEVNPSDIFFIPNVPNTQRQAM